MKYGETGIMSFMIGREGFVYEQDLGPNTAKLAQPVSSNTTRGDIGLPLTNFLTGRAGSGKRNFSCVSRFAHFQ